MEEDYIKKREETQHNLQEAFSNRSDMEMMRATKNLTTRMRMNKQFSVNKEWADKHLMPEYAQYHKYESNFISQQEKERPFAD